MKKIAVLMALAMAATASFGAVNINWSNYGFLSGADSSLAATQDSTKILWELVYTSGDSIATPTLDSSTGAISYGSDEVISSRLWEKGSTEVKVTDAVTSATPSATPLVMDLDYAFIDSAGQEYLNMDYSKSGGGIYAAVFQYCTDGNVYWAHTDLNTGINWATDGMGAQDEVHFDMETDTQIAGLLGEIERVPEPATMSLLGLGALAMVLRRKLRK